MFSHIVPCGIADRPVTSLAAEGITATMSEVIEALIRRAGVSRCSPEVVPTERSSARRRRHRKRVTKTERRSEKRPLDSSAGGGRCRALVDRRRDRCPQAPLATGPGGEWVTRTWGCARRCATLDLVTVCEEAGCPNIYECWADGTATFMINGSALHRPGVRVLPGRHQPPVAARSRASRCGSRRGGRQDGAGARGCHRRCRTPTTLPDGGAEAFAEVIAAIRRRTPSTTVEILVPDCKGDEAALRVAVRCGA